MTPEEELKKKIFKEYGKQLNIKDVDIKVIIQDRPPEPAELGSDGKIIKYLGKIGKYFVHAIMKGYLILNFICSPFSIYELPQKFQFYFPKSYEFVVNYGNKIFSGDTKKLQDPNKKEDGYLVLRQNWLVNENNFQKDYLSYQKGTFNDFNTQDMWLAPASSSSGTVTDSTSSIEYKVRITYNT